MVSRENTIIVVCLLVGLVVGYAISEYTTLSSWIAIAAFVILGIILPVSINTYAGWE